MKHLFTIAFLICIFPILSVRAADKELSQEELLQLMDKHRDTIVPLPDEHIFDGMKIYNYDDVKWSEDRKTPYTHEGELLTGVTVGEKKIEGTQNLKKIYTRWEKGKIADTLIIEENNWTDYYARGKHLYQKFLGNQLINESIKKDTYGYERQYSAFGKLLYDVISSNKLRIMRGYDKNGEKIFEAVTTVPNGTCRLKDGTKRQATLEDIDKFYKKAEIAAFAAMGIKNDMLFGYDGDYKDYEFDFECEE